MPRKNKPNFQDGDILLFHNGEMAQVLEVEDNMTRLLSMFDDESTFKQTYSLEGMHVNLGQDLKTLALFHATRSIHVRLNKFNGV